MNHEYTLQELDSARTYDLTVMNNSSLTIDIANEIIRYQGKARVHQNKILTAVGSLLANLQLAQSNPHGLLALTHDHHQFRLGSRYNPYGIGWHAWRESLQSFYALGFTELVYKGRLYPDGTSFPSRVKSLLQPLTEPLEWRDVPIRLQRTEKQRTKSGFRRSKIKLEFEDSPETEGLAQEVLSIQDFLASSKIHHPSSWRTRLYRVFNPDWSHCGRLYGGWWQTLPKRERKLITINNNPTVELDYTCFHPSLLYAALGEELPDDPYNITDLARDESKVLVQLMLNSKCPKLAIISKQRLGKLNPDIPPQKMIDDFSWRHQKISRFFGSGMGRKLQFIDSLMSIRLLKWFKSASITVLPIHDSYLVEARFENVLLRKMDDGFNYGVELLQRILWVDV